MHHKYTQHACITLAHFRVPYAHTLHTQGLLGSQRPHGHQKVVVKVHEELKIGVSKIKGVRDQVGGSGVKIPASGLTLSNGMGVKGPGSASCTHIAHMQVCGYAHNSNFVMSYQETNVLCWGKTEQRDKTCGQALTF